MGDVEFWGNSEGTSGVPEARGLLTPYPSTMRKAPLILLSQTGSTGQKEESAWVSHLLAVEP